MPGGEPPDQKCTVEIIKIGVDCLVGDVKAPGYLGGVEGLGVYNREHLEKALRELRLGGKPPRGQISGCEQLDIIAMPLRIRDMTQYAAVRIAAVEPQVLALACGKFAPEERGQFNQRHSSDKRFGDVLH